MHQFLKKKVCAKDSMRHQNHQPTSQTCPMQSTLNYLKGMYSTTMAWYDTLQARYYTLTAWYKRFPVLANPNPAKWPLMTLPIRPTTPQRRAKTRRGAPKLRQGCVRRRPAASKTLPRRSKTFKDFPKHLNTPPTPSQDAPNSPQDCAKKT